MGRRPQGRRVATTPLYRVHEHGDPKVSDLDAAIVAKEQIGRLEIKVDSAMLVHVPKSLCGHTAHRPDPPHHPAVSRTHAAS